MTKVVKMFLKSEFTLFQNSALLIDFIPCHSINFVKHCIFLSATKREIRQFHIMVVQGWQRNVEKRMMYMQNCCFANINLQCIALCRSCCCGCHHCFRFLITNSERYVFICRTSKNIAMHWKGECMFVT